MLQDVLDLEAINSQCPNLLKYRLNRLVIYLMCNEKWTHPTLTTGRILFCYSFPEKGKNSYEAHEIHSYTFHIWQPISSACKSRMLSGLCHYVKIPICWTDLVPYKTYLMSCFPSYLFSATFFYRSNTKVGAGIRLAIVRQIFAMEIRRKMLLPETINPVWIWCW
jgi:hypothetical protein